MSATVKQILNRLARVVATLGISVLTSACASSQKGKIIQWAAAGGAIGGTYGSSRTDYQDKNAMMYGAVGAAIGALAGLYYHDPDKHSENLVLENQKLKKDLELIQTPKVLVETPATFNTKIPEKYKKLINPGEWRISEIDQWIEESENRLIHQDKIMELIPPTLNPNLSSQRDKTSR